MNRRLIKLPLLLLAVLAGCGESVEGPDQLKGGVLATFDVSGERFRIWVTNATTIQQLLELDGGQGNGNARIPIGPLGAGAGLGSHNDPWSWHLDPKETVLADLTIELCDGRPSFVEADLDEWLNNVGSFCPWGADLVELEDRR